LRSRTRTTAAIAAAMNHPTIGTDFDFDLLGVLAVGHGRVGPATVLAATLVRGPFDELLAGGKMGVIAAAMSGMARLSAAFPRRRGRVVIDRRTAGLTPSTFGGATEQVLFQLADFRLGLFQLGGQAMDLLDRPCV